MMLKFNNRQNKLKKLQETRRAYIEQLAFIRQFKKDEDGGLIILTLLLLISMLVVGGMAVDFMRFESERTKLQSVSDRAVLAAASLNQNRDAATVITDFFDAEGYSGAIIGQPIIDKNSVGSTVTVNSQTQIDTFYLRLIGMDTLTAPATASAIEGTGNVEVSLVLDISGSMRELMTGQAHVLVNGEKQFDNDGKIITETRTASRMFFLQQAAKQFIDDLLLPEYENRVSINLVAYSQHVSIGDGLYYALRTTPDTMTEPDPITGESIIGSSYGGLDEDGAALPFAWTTTDPNTGSITDNWNDDGAIIATGNFDWTNGLDYVTNPSRCVTFEDAEYNQLAFDSDRIYEQVEHVDFYSNDSTFRVGYEPCPAQDFQGIILLSQDADELKDAIDDYIPTLNTSIHRGMKWGVSLLDPSMRDLIAGIPTVDPAFRGTRPSDYFTGITSKYVVIITDGFTVSSERILDEYYDEFHERDGLADQSAYYYARNDPDGSTRAGYSNGNRFNNMTETIGTTTQLNAKLSQICDLAGKSSATYPNPPIDEIYTISLGVTNTTMTNCASKDGNAFRAATSSNSSEPALDEIFSSIAAQITALRLSL
ncbi:MAG: pilus assembly protein TadG-related protein [Yoonia sp.]